MGCVPSYNKHCDTCIRLLKEYNGEIKKNNFINAKNMSNHKKNTNFYKIKLNKAFVDLNKVVKYQHEKEQLKELNEIYQKLLSLDSERNNNLYEENDINNLNQVSY